MIFLLQWLLLSLFTVPIQEEPSLPAIRFEIVNAGITVDGHFEESSFNVRFDPKNLKTSTLEGTVRVASIQTGITLRDRHLLGRQYFRADAFPEINVRSKNITNDGKGKYLGVFQIRIKDVAKEMSFPFAVETLGKTRHFKARFTLNRLDFGLGEKSLILAEEVTVVLDVPVSTI